MQKNFRFREGCVKKKKKMDMRSSQIPDMWSPDNGWLNAGGDCIEYVEGSSPPFWINVMRGRRVPYTTIWIEGSRCWCDVKSRKPIPLLDGAWVNGRFFVFLSQHTLPLSNITAASIQMETSVASDQVIEDLNEQLEDEAKKEKKFEDEMCYELREQDTKIKEQNERIDALQKENSNLKNMLRDIVHCIGEDHEVLQDTLVELSQLGSLWRERFLPLKLSTDRMNLQATLDNLQIIFNRE